MEPWNRINIPCPPGARSSIHVQLTSKQVGNLKGLLMENAKVLKLLQGNILKTEIRVLYELLYVRNNSMRRQKTFQRLKQVEQCINRLKNMKLDAALQDLVDLCPNSFQMSVCIKTGVCDVPSQPMLEWICLKVLGASKLLSCTLTRCIKAFVLFKRHMKWRELINLHVVITSMLSRLWVIFRGILVGLNNLHQNLLEFLKDVAQAQPMPYLTDTTLPADLAEFPGPSDASLLRSPNIKHTFDKVKSASKDLHKKQRLRKKVEEATTFTQMSASLEELILHCRSQRKTKRLLAFLHLKCKRMKCLEATGYTLPKKLQYFKRDIRLALSVQGLRAKKYLFTAACRRPYMRIRFHSLKMQKSRAHAKKARHGRSFDDI